LKELAAKGVTPQNVKDKLTIMANEIDEEIVAIEAQIPTNLEDLLNGEDDS